MSAALGENILTPAGGQVVEVSTPTPPRPARRYCPNRDKPRPRWLPPDRFCCPQDHYLQATYGITCDQYWELFERQGRRCAICHRPPWKGRRLVVDHCHDTGNLDGLVHFGCNRRLQTRWRRYLADPPGRRLGLVVAPTKLKAIQAADAAKRERERQRRAEREAAKHRPGGPGSASQLDKLRAMTRKGA